MKLFWKQKIKTKGTALIPKGVKSTVVPVCWPDGKVNPVWDEHLFLNKKYLK